MNTKSTPMYWYNFDTKQPDLLETMPTTDEEVMPYLNDNPAVRNIYKVYRSAGKTIQEAYLNSMHAERL